MLGGSLVWGGEFFVVSGRKFCVVSSPEEVLRGCLLHFFAGVCSAENCWDSF